MANVLVSGSGIAGPALAWGLRRRGIDVTIVERAPRLRPGGYAVDVRGAALLVLERMGLRDALRPFETDTRVTAVVDRSGRRFAELPRGFGVIDEGDVEIGRGDLSRLLHEHTRGFVDYRFGESIAALAEDEAGVDVTFASGRRERFDAVIGADGVHSRTRALAFGPEEECVRELGLAMAIFSVPNVLGLDREQLLFQSSGHVASVKSARGNADLQVCVFFACPPGTFDHGDVERQRARVRAAFADEGWAFPELLAHLDDADDFYADVTAQVHVPAHARGRVALLGDAGYCPSPLSGQGTSLALVGAHVLATLMSAEPDDLPAAFARYDAAITPFVRANQAIVDDIAGGFMPRSRFAAWARTTGMRLMPYLPGTGLVMKLALRPVRSASRAIDLTPFDESAPRGSRSAPEKTLVGNR